MIDKQLTEKIEQFGALLMDQEKASVIIPAQEQKSGFWFGGGNMIEWKGSLYVCGRYRSGGDSRTGVKLGTRGCELAIWRSDDEGKNWKKVVSMNKADLNVGDLEVLSIEGCALHRTAGGDVELFISTEKKGRVYTGEFADYLKPGTGIWSIDYKSAPSVEKLQNSPVREIHRSEDLTTINVKDPFVYDCENGDTWLLFCHHPFCWSSSDTGFMVRPRGEKKFRRASYNIFPRGNTWDVAITRGTSLIDLPVESDEKITALFYDGGESLRQLDEHAGAVKRPRGFSCEEIGGLAVISNEDVTTFERISRYKPSFLSPMGMRTSRYADVLEFGDKYYVTWQQSQDDLSQPLVLNVVEKRAAEGIFRKN